MRPAKPDLASSFLPRWRSPSPISFHGRSRRALLSQCGLIIFALSLTTFLFYRPLQNPCNAAPPKGPTCDPWSTYGHLVVNREVPEENIWRPFLPLVSVSNLTSTSSQADSSLREPLNHHCIPPPLFRALRESLSVRSPSLTPYPPALSSHLLQFLHNRTVLLIGDSVSRELIIHFCSLLGREAETIGPGHKFDVSEEVPAEWIPIEWYEREEWESWRRDKEVTTRPHMCYIPEWDFLVVNIFHWGLDETDYWRTKDQYTPPGLLEHRLHAIAKPLLSRLSLPSADGGLAPHARSPVPDLIELSSGLWDLARWARLDLDQQQMTITDLGEERLKWWRSRTADVVREVKAIWPQSKLVWRSGHWPSDQSAKIDWFMGWSWDNPDVHRPFFHHNRLVQLDDAARSLFLPARWVTDSRETQDWERHMSRLGLEGVGWSEWGRILLGQHAHQQDQLHPGPLPAGYLWGDMMLYELRSATGCPVLEQTMSMPPADT